MGTLPREMHPLRKGFARALAKCLMLHLIIDLVGILTEPGRKAFQRPDGQAIRVNLRCHLAWVFAGLRVASHLVEQLGGGRPKKSLDHRPEVGLLCWALFLRDKIAR